MTVAFAALTDLQQKFALESVGLPVPLPAVDLWQGVLLGIADVPLLVVTADIDAIVATPPVVRIPGSKTWVLGMATHQGGLLPIICSDSLFYQRPYTGRKREYCMVIKRPGFHFALTLSTLERTVSLPLAQRDMQHPVVESFAPYCAGGFIRGDQFLPILDINKLVADRALSDTAANSEHRAEDPLQ